MQDRSLRAAQAQKSFRMCSARGRDVVFQGVFPYPNLKAFGPEDGSAIGSSQMQPPFCQMGPIGTARVDVSSKCFTRNLKWLNLT
jgi:hypothetical protein